MEFVGKLTLNGQVDITDPCYDKSAWCRMTSYCQPGEYYGYVETKDEGKWGIRVSKIMIFKDNKFCNYWDIIGRIGVDAGMAGFFNNKPDFNDEEWSKLCDAVLYNGKAWAMYDGIFSDSGYGDGTYPVFTNEDRSAFMIMFIGDYDDEEDYEE